MDDAYVPTREELWIFVREFAQTTESSLTRLENKIDVMGSSLNLRLDRVDARLERVETRLDSVETRLERVEARLTSIEAWKVPLRLDDHEMRIARLERQSG